MMFLQVDGRTSRCPDAANRTIENRSIKSSENIEMKEAGPDEYVSNKQFPSVTLNELSMKVRESIL